MDYFSKELETRKDEIDEQIMDLLLSFSDFEAFKEMMLFERAHFVASTPKPKSRNNSTALKTPHEVVTLNKSSPYQTTSISSPNPAIFPHA